jgi:hypothetical protein
VIFKNHAHLFMHWEISVHCAFKLLSDESIAWKEASASMWANDKTAITSGDLTFWSPKEEITEFKYK